MAYLPLSSRRKDDKIMKKIALLLVPLLLGARGCQERRAQARRLSATERRCD